MTASNSGNVPTADDFEFEKQSVHQCMGGDFWRVTARLYNFDAKEVEYYDDPHIPVDVTREWDRREYELTRLDPSSLGTETQRVSEQNLISHFDNEATEKQAREHYEREKAT